MNARARWLVNLGFNAGWEARADFVASSPDLDCTVAGCRWGTPGDGDCECGSPANMLAALATPENVAKIRKIGARGQKRHPDTRAMFEQLAAALEALRDEHARALKYDRDRGFNRPREERAAEAREQARGAPVIDRRLT